MRINPVWNSYICHICYYNLQTLIINGCHVVFMFSDLYILQHNSLIAHIKI